MHGTTEQMGSFILLRQPFPSPSTHCDGLYCLSRIDWRDMFVFNSGHREIVNCKGSSNQFGSIYKKCAPFFFPLVCRASLFPQNSHLTRSHYRWPKKKTNLATAAHISAMSLDRKREKCACEWHPRKKQIDGNDLMSELKEFEARPICRHIIFSLMDLRSIGLTTGSFNPIE